MKVNEGYRAQYSFEPRSLYNYSGNYQGIDVNFIVGTTDSNGQPVYRVIRDASHEQERQNRRIQRRQ